MTNSKQNQTQINQIMINLEKYFSKNYAPVQDFEKLQKNDPFKVLISTILSLRTKDQTTIKVAKNLFKKIKTFQDLNQISQSELETLIHSCGFYKTKAKSLKNISKEILEKYNNTVPNEINTLLKLPGVGRKTANLVISLGFQKPAICVDVHVHRISNRIGYTKTKTPEQTEHELRKSLPKTYWNKYNQLLVSLGQTICKPQNPNCQTCPIKKYCKKIII